MVTHKEIGEDRRQEKETDHVLPFLDVLIDNTHRNSVVTSTFRKKTLTGLPTNCFSFTPLSYKIGLIRTLIDRVFKINNTWLGFHKDITKLVFILRKNLFPVHRKQYFYKLPSLGRISTVAQSIVNRGAIPLY